MPLTEFDNVVYYAETLGLEVHRAEDGYEEITSGEFRAFNQLVQVEIPPTSSLVGVSLSVPRLRSLHGIDVLGIKRGNNRKDGPIGDVALQPKDILILDAGKGADITGLGFNNDFADLHELKVRGI